MQEIDRLVDALTSAFPTTAELTRFARVRFSSAVPEMGWQNVKAGAFDLVEWTAAEGILEELLRALQHAAPDNPEVRALDEVRLVPAPEHTEAIARIPLGPRVPLECIDERIILALAAAAHTRVRAHFFVMAANRLRRSVDPEASVIQLHRLPGFDVVGSWVFWFETVADACRHGPRMLASLVMEHRARLKTADAGITELLDTLTRGGYRMQSGIGHV